MAFDTSIFETGTPPCKFNAKMGAALVKHAGDWTEATLPRRLEVDRETMRSGYVAFTEEGPSWSDARSDSHKPGFRMYLHSSASLDEIGLPFGIREVCSNALTLCRQVADFNVAMEAQRAGHEGQNPIVEVDFVPVKTRHGTMHPAQFTIVDWVDRNSEFLALDKKKGPSPEVETAPTY